MLKAARKTLVKLTPVVIFTNIKRVAFPPIFVRQKNYKSQTSSTKKPRV